MKPSSSYTILKSFRLQYLLKRGFTPTSKSIYNFLLHLSQSQKFNIIIQIFNQLNPNFIHGNFKTHSIFADALLKLHKFEQAECFIYTHLEKSKSITKPPVFPKTRFWDALIQGFCVELKNPRKGFDLLKDCLKNNNGVCPSSSTFYSLIVCFIYEGSMSKAIEVLEIMKSDEFRYPFDNFVCSAVISRFCRVNKPELAIGFFDNAFNSGALKPNLVTYTAVVTALCMLGRVHEVRDLVLRMEKEGVKFDAVFYSNWISGFLREGMLTEAFLEHKRMLETGLNPDPVSYTVLIDGFCKDGNVEKAFGFLSKMIKHGVNPNSVTYTTIIRGLCKKGKMKEAFSMFRNIEDMGVEMDEFMYATLIHGVCCKGDLNHVFTLLGEMEKKGIKPTIVTYNTVVNGLCKVGKVFEANEVSKGDIHIDIDIVTYSTLLHGYVEDRNIDGILETKRRFDESGVRIDVVMCNILLKALVMIGAFEDARALYDEMTEMGLEANSITHCTMMDGYSKAGRIEEALEFFDEFRKASSSSSMANSMITTYRSMIHSLCRKGMLDIAIEVFIELYEKGLGFDFDVYTTLLESIFTVEGAKGVLDLVYKLDRVGSGSVHDIVRDVAIDFLCRRGSLEGFLMFRKIGLVPSSESYYSITKRFLADRKWSLIGPLTSTFVKEYGLLQPTVGKMVLSYLCMYNVDIALRFLETMNENGSSFAFPTNIFKKLVEDNRSLSAYKLVTRAKMIVPIIDVVDYTIMVNGLCVEGYPTKALKLCSFAKRRGVICNIVTYNTIIHGLCREGCLIEAVRVFDSLERIGLVPSEITYSILIDGLGKEGLLVNARKMFDRMVLKGIKPNVRVYSSIIFGYCKFGNVEQGVKVLSDLVANRVSSPDEFTISSIIYGYCLKGEIEEALVFFDEFKTRCTSPDFLGFLYLIKGLCNKGRIEEARSVLRDMFRSESVEELINRIDSEVESEWTESVKGFLVDLCEQGRVEEAVSVLDEMGSIFFPKRTVGSKSRKMGNEDELSRCYDGVGERFRDRDFGFCYSVIRSLCSKGEVEKANRLVKNMISKVPVNR